MTSFFPLLVALISTLSLGSVDAYNAARSVLQPLNERSTYRGGWALSQAGSGSSCPANISVPCSTQGSGYNLACCPDGQTGFSSGSGSYCCPTEADCYTVVENFPTCADLSWIMFVYSSSVYFCCQSGQLAVIPRTGAGGICEPASQVVPTSLLATITSQDVATATSTSTAATDPTTTGIAAGNSPNPTESSSTSPSPSSSAASPSTNSFPISTRTAIIVGILVGAFVLLVIGFSFFRRLARKPRFHLERQRFPDEGRRTIFPAAFRTNRQSRRTTEDLPPPYTGTTTERYDPSEEVRGWQRAEMEEQRQTGRPEIPTGEERHELG